MNVAVVGAGSWGTALAMVLAANKHRVTIWGRDADALAGMERTRRNERYLPGIELPGDWTCEGELSRAVAGRDCIVMAVPSKAFHDVAARIGDGRPVLVSVTKGIEFETGRTMCGVLRDCLPGARVAALSGPGFAGEVARGLPTAIVGAAETAETQHLVQELFHRPTFRVYRSSDLLGVELGGALKNVIAIAAGVCQGLRLGDSAMAALVTRGIAEMRRIGVACGAQAETFAGLSGIGDLTLTCFSKQSRNHQLGERAGRGEKMADLLAPGAKLAEGVPTARSARQLGRRLGVETPIVDEVHAMLFEGKDVRHAVSDLLGRDSKAED